MPFPCSVEKLQEEPIVILKFFEVDQSQPPPTEDEIYTVLDPAPEPVFLIIDLSDIKLSLDQLVSSTNQTVRGGSSLFTHPNIRERLMVSTNPMLKLASKGMASKVFGNIKIQAFDNVADALAYARAAQ
ncbi:MAG: hypothetical protein JXB30_05760 [Anaerolineae bacterium]|nr:hypothetical protein [Anaerolineae bacterium]